MNTVAFLGIGAMGSRLAHNLLNAGYNLRVWNRTTQRCIPLVEKGAILAPSPKEAAQTANIVIAMVSDDLASRKVWLDRETGAIHGLKSNTVAIEYSTLTPGWCRELATKINEHGSEFIDAPVIGSLPQAETCQLIHLVGGEKKIVATISTLLEVNSISIHHLGELGAGMTMKLAVNALFGTQVVALSEILGLLQKAGLSTESSVNLLNQIPTTSPALKGIGLLIAAGNHQPLFPIDLAEKDVSYLEQLARSLKVEIPTIKKIMKIYQQAQKAGYGNQNISGVARLYLGNN